MSFLEQMSLVDTSLFIPSLSKRIPRDSVIG